MADARHDQLRTRLAAYALGALDEYECADVDDHLRSCAPCSRELLKLQATATLMMQHSAEPTDELWERIRQRAERTDEEG